MHRSWKRKDERDGRKERPQLCTKAIVYVPLFQGNHIAAAIFEWVFTYTEIETRLWYREPFYIYRESAGGPLSNPGPFQDYFGYCVDVDANLEVDIASLRAMILPQLVQPVKVTDQEIFDALDLLRETYLLSWHTWGNNEKASDTLFYFSTLYEPRIDEALTALYHGQHFTGSTPLFDLNRV